MEKKFEMNTYFRFTGLKILKNTIFVLIMIVSVLAFFFNAKCLSATAACLAGVSIVLEFCLAKKVKKDFNRLYHTAYFDGLTGIPSRTSADLYIAECTDPQLVSVVVADLDGLKMVNDAYGHQAGDILIQDFAASFSEASAPHGFAARNGGDEFLAIFRGENAEEQADTFCRKLRRIVDHKNNTAQYPIHYSIGYASGKELQYASTSEIISLADARMYQQKQEKKSARKMSDGRNLCEINQHTR